MRILVAASGGEGHLGPLLPFVDAAAEAGDDVTLVVPPGQVATARSTGADVRVVDAPPADEVARVRRALASSDREVRVRAAEVELFGRINTAAALEKTVAAVADVEPELILREPCDYASAIAAVRSAVPVATVGISPGLADISGLRMASRVIEDYAPGVTTTLEAAPYLTRFPGDDPTGYPDTRRYGFTIDLDARTEQNPPLVWLTMGTVNTQLENIRGTWDAAVTALADLDVSVLASTGRGGSTVRGTDRMEVVDWIELQDILSRASVVVCHGGSGTTLATLAAGVPLVTVPMIADQPTNAAMVESLGAGITVAPSSPGAGLTVEDAPRLRRAIHDVLTDPSYRSSARRAATRFSEVPSVSERLAQLRLT
ncbi:hypothetical protein CH300_05650 [Rhodococcus sp. 15-1154-1]|nr:glycosyltransferase [Rhodococcus sp. 15-1154-1]OZF07432.1 hypothetical protein CH300_05650 [Rhodococcus sp. 15-1154-1]